MTTNWMENNRLVNRLVNVNRNAWWFKNNALLKEKSNCTA